jgi:hypothetical protein
MSKLFVGAAFSRDSPSSRFIAAGKPLPQTKKLLSLRFSGSEVQRFNGWFFRNIYRMTDVHAFPTLNREP